MMWNVFFSFIAAGIALCLLRAIKGPTSSDRIVGIDAMVTISIALMVLLGSLYNKYIYLVVSLFYAVLAFIGLLAVARYLERCI